MDGLLEAPVSKSSKTRQRAQFVPFNFASRYVIDLLEFHPDHGGYRCAQWKPKPGNLLAVPKASLIAETHRSEEIYFDQDERPLLTRDEALAAVAEWNQGTVRLMQGNEPKFIWWFVIELGFNTGNGSFAAIDHESGEFDLLGMRYRLVKPTAEEIAKYAGKVGAA